MNIRKNQSTDEHSWDVQETYFWGNKVQKMVTKIFAINY